MYFGLAKSLQEKYDCDLFAIIDITNKSKKFFQEQQLVKFQKFWFYHDHISTTKKADLTYLAAFEKKYKINLWLLACNERLFYEFNEYYKFSTDEILSILDQECRLFESILDEVKPDFLIMYPPNFHYDYLFYHMCKTKGIKILIMGASRFGYRCIISQETDKLDSVESSDGTESKRTIEELQNYLLGFDMTEEGLEFKSRFMNSKWNLLKAGFEFFLSNNSNVKTHYTYYGRTKLKVIIKRLGWLLRERVRESFINRNLSRVIDEKTPFVYFPLTVEPESTLLIGAPFYTNQLELIKHIVKSLPVGYKLYVKDHPIQSSRGWRSISYYKQIMNLPNVHLLHHSVSSKEIIKKCSLVITIASTSGLEAAFYRKPSIVLIDVLYSMLPSVYKLKSIEELPQAIRTSLEKVVDPSDLGKFVNIVDKNSFEFNLSGFDMDYTDYFFYSGFLVDVDIPISKMESFLEESNNKSKFEKIAMEHIKKIKQYKESERDK